MTATAVSPIGVTIARVLSVGILQTNRADIIETSHGNGWTGVVWLEGNCPRGHGMTVIPGRFLKEGGNSYVRPVSLRLVNASHPLVYLILTRFTVHKNLFLHKCMV